jgi:hypothetical protein
MDCKGLRQLADELFEKKLPLNTLWQELSDNFYPERADFTTQRSLGTDFASNLMSSYPVMCRRELGNQLGTMLRPTARPWFHPKRRHNKREDEDNETRQWLEWFEETQRRAMYDPRAMMTRATKEADHDFACFGQPVLSVEMNFRENALLYRCWHLRDMAWEEDEVGAVGAVFRKWKPSAHAAHRTFRDKVHTKVKELLDKHPFELVDFLHMVVPAEMYDDDARGRPRWSIWYDCANEHLIEATPIWGRHYVIPRWQTVSGSQYAYSPAAVCGIPDARLLQAMTFTLLEAGEKASNPPMIATSEAVRSDLALYSGGVTWVDRDYDEKTGEALRPIAQDFHGVQYGLQMNADTRAMLHKAFFLDALTLPQRAPEMTAYEVGQRVQEYIRNALPIFEPMEMEYNAALCDESFELLWRNGGFGDPRSWPRSLRGAEIDFGFESPLHDAIEQMKGQKFQEAGQLIAGAISLDPSCAYVPRAEVALRDALHGIGVPSKWLNSESDVQQKKDVAEQQARASQMLGAMEQGASIAKDLGQSGMVPTAQTQGAVAPV